MEVSQGRKPRAAPNTATKTVNVGFLTCQWARIVGIRIRGCGTVFEVTSLPRKMSRVMVEA